MYGGWSASGGTIIWKYYLKYCTIAPIANLTHKEKAQTDLLPDSKKSLELYNRNPTRLTAVSTGQDVLRQQIADYSYSKITKSYTKSYLNYKHFYSLSHFTS